MRPIKIDASGNPEQPTFVLATRSAKRLGNIPGTHSWKYHKIFNGADEIFFDVEKFINSEPNPLWDEVMDLRLVWFVEVDTWFQIATEVDEGETTVKHVTGTALSEAELSQVNVYDLEINTESDILRDDYIDPTVFYDPAKPECSLLDRMLYKFPNYSIGHVDLSLRNVQRQFSLTDTSVYDAFQSVSQEIGCLFVFDSGTDSDTGLPKRTIHAYDLQSYCNNCGKRFEEHTTICPYCGSDDTQAPYGDESQIIVSQDNLTEDIQLTSDVDSTKNCLRLQGGDDAMTAAIRHCTPDGSGYIWYISDDMRKDMSDELRARLDSFDALSRTYQTGHDFIVDSDAYNALVTKYDPDYDEYSRIFSGGTTGTGTDIVLGSYTDLVEADYSAYDFYYYLHDSMMPTYTRPDYDVQTQVLNLRTGLTSGISLLNISSSTSASTAESALRSMSRHYVNTGKYSISVSTDSWSVVGGNTGIWSGSITLTNSRDNTDTASTGTITVSFSSDPEQYMDQLIQNKIDAALASDYDIASVFSLELDDFVEVLPAYSLSVLEAYHDCCQTCIDVLIQQGCGNPDGTTTGGITWDAYNELYLPWRNKLLALEDEIAVRTAEVDTVLDMIDQVESRINETHNILDLETYLGETLWKEFIPYRREDEYTNTNFISDGLTNAEIITLSREFINLASKELYKSAELQHSISSTLHNLLIMKEFQPLADNFDVGVWIWVIIDDKPYKLRLLEYTIDWDASDKIDVEFSDVSHWASTYTDLQSVLNSARNMTTTYGALTRKADEASTKMKWFDDGINATTMAVSNNNTDQSMQFNKNGLYMFGYDYVIDAFTDEQLKILNDVIAFTDDGWETVKVALGKIVVDGEVKYGILAENIYGRMGKFVELDADTLTAGTISDRNGYNYWNLETGEFRLSSTAGIGDTGKTIGDLNETATTANSTANAASAAVTALDQGLDSTGVFNRLTNNGAIQGLYMDENGNLYVNATYINGGTLDANQMTVSNLSANSITTGTFDASKITVVNLSASAITSGTMSANRISGGTIDASDVTITNLDADNITSGTITANYISGGTLNFNNVTVTGNLSASRINGGTLDFDNFRVNHLSASDISTGTLSADYISGGTIDASDVTITNLDADNISTGHLTSSNIKLIGNMEVYNNSGSNVGGYLGYAESTTSNTGMHMLINYTSNLGGYWSTSETICTNSGCRMSYSYSESSSYSIAQVFVSYESGYGGAYCGIGNGNYPTNLVFNGNSSSQTTYVYGKLNFSNATVTGLNVTATFG